jgi:predicted metal-dependent peptidase
MTTDEGGDPFAVLEQAARRQDAEEKLAKLIGQARTRLVLSRGGDAAFWATLALRLKVKPAWDKETLSTDGKTLLCNPLFVASLTDDERVGVIAHEVAHLALAHHTRKGSRDHATWNVAGDLVINPLLIGGGFTLPSCRLIPGEGDYAAIPTGLSTEETYARLQQHQHGERQKDQPGGGKSGHQGCGQGDPGGCGGVEEPGDGTDAAKSESEAEWQVAVAQARNAARMRGSLSAGLDRFIDAVLRPVVDWRAVLREFVTRTARNDYRMTPPNRRFVHQGLYLPVIRGDELGGVLLAVDTSGSIGGETLKVFAGEIQGVLDAYEGARLTILYHDSQVRHVQRWESSDGPIRLEPKGGGGTDHRPVFDWIAKEGLDAACLVCLTDLASVFPDRAPDYAVLWASVARGVVAPFGQLVEVVL